MVLFDVELKELDTWTVGGLTWCNLSLLFYNFTISIPWTSYWLTESHSATVVFYVDRAEILPNLLSGKEKQKETRKGRKEGRKIRPPQK